MSYPGLNSETKAHLWKTVCAPSLLYGCESLNISHNELYNLESLQGTLIKQALGLSKRSHHSNILEALNIPKLGETINEHVLSLYYRIYCVESPVRDLCRELLFMYVSKQLLVKGTIIERVVRLGHSPLSVAFTKHVKNKYLDSEEDGVVSSLKFLLHHENYINIHSEEHLLTSLLTRAF